ncbi:hypothetical protein [Allorhizocola rhizosphaerae]|nr:hypothetical protein [Allorhizocola rhizosphaerae]
MRRAGRAVRTRRGAAQELEPIRVAQVGYSVAEAKAGYLQTGL